MSDTHHDPIAQRKEYFKVFGYLVALTVFEVAIVSVPLPKSLITLLVVVASCTKAGLVGYYYMHLKSESRALKILACLPLIMFGYLAVLGPDANHRQAHVYLPEAPRVLPEHSAHGEAGTHSPEEVAAEEAEKQLIENSEARLKAEKSGSAATAPAPSASGPSGAATEGSNQPGADDFR